MDQYTAGQITGWINVLLLVFLISNYGVLKLKSFRTSFPGKILKKAHPFFAMTLIVLSITHLYLIWGKFLVIHTGHLIFISIVLSALFSIAGKRLKKPVLFKIHTYTAFASVILLLLHLWKPYLLQ